MPVLSTRFKLIFFICLFYSTNSLSQKVTFGNILTKHNKNYEISTQDSLGLPISVREFDSLVYYYLTKFDIEIGDKNIEQYLTLIRVVNTISFDFLSLLGDDYLDLRFLFNRIYFYHLDVLMDFEVSYHLGLYSKKYNILIGGKETANNFYRFK